MSEFLDRQLDKLFKNAKNYQLPTATIPTLQQDESYDDFFAFFETLDEPEQISNPLPGNVSPQTSSDDPLQLSANVSPQTIQNLEEILFGEPQSPLEQSPDTLPQSPLEQSPNTLPPLSPSPQLPRKLSLREMEEILFGEPLTPLRTTLEAAQVSAQPFDDELSFNPAQVSTSLHPFEEELNFSPDSLPSYSPHSPEPRDATKRKMDDVACKKKKCLSRIEKSLPPQRDDDFPLSKLLPTTKDPRIKKHSPIRAPVRLQRPKFAIKRKFLSFPQQKFHLPPQKQFHRHKITHVLALREGEYVLTDGCKTLMRRDAKKWSSLLETDLQSMKLFILDLYCADETSYLLLKREKTKWIESHPIHVLKTTRLVPKKNLESCKMCENPDCLKHLAIKGGIQRFVAYAIDVPPH